jgi:hypothetical protein
MHVWSSWYDAMDWLYYSASEDCSFLVSDWKPGEVSILKFDRYEKGNGSAHYRGTFRTVPECCCI